MKKVLFGVILGIVLCSGIVYAATLYKATDISYTKDGWEVSSVNEALDSLYENALNSNTRLVEVGNSNNFNITEIVGEKYLGEYSTADFIVCDNYSSTIDTGHVTYAGGHDWTISGGQLYIQLVSNSVLTYDNSTGDVNVTPRVIKYSDNLKYYSSSSGWSYVGTHSVNVSIPFKVYLLVKTPNANV